MNKDYKTVKDHSDQRISDGNISTNYLLVRFLEVIRNSSRS